MKNKEEIKNILESDNSERKCSYCDEPINRGYYAESGIGRRLCFPKILTKAFTNKEIEIPIHYKCVEPFIFEMIREGGDCFEGTRDNTKILIRY